MNRRNRPRRDEPDAEQPQPQTPDEGAWDSPEFLRKLLINMAFVAAPAIVMAAVREYGYAVAWFGVGAAIIIFDARRQIRAWWRSWRSKGRDDQKEGET